uniref:Putative secreted protein n=1 Tax=Anopheles triannulatus TaxID=58253 RepID=A0A2M4B6P4_9DIPT
MPISLFIYSSASVHRVIWWISIEVTRFLAMDLQQSIVGTAIRCAYFFAFTFSLEHTAAIRNGGLRLASRCRSTSLLSLLEVFFGDVDHVFIAGALAKLEI